MDRHTAETILNKQVKIVTRNNLHFTGRVLDVLENSLIILDKYGERVTLNFEIIMICSEASNGY